MDNSRKTDHSKKTDSAAFGKNSQELRLRIIVK